MLGRLRAGEFITIVVLVVGGLVWAVRLEGRVNAQEIQLAEIKQSNKEAIDQVRSDLGYIRSRIDQAVGR